MYTEHVGELLSPPKETDELPPLFKRSYAIKGKKTDIVISGLGWVTCRGDTANLDVYAPKGVAVSVRPAIV